MCLSFPQDDKTPVFEGHRRVHASSVTCNGTYLHAHIHGDGSKSVIHTIPVKGTKSVIFPVDEEFVPFMKPCNNCSCLATEINAIMNPGKHVPYSESLYSMYRSIDNPVEVESYQIDPLVIIVNPDGGITAVIPIGKITKRNMTQKERARLGPNMLKCIEQGLKKIDKTIKDLFVTGHEMPDFELLGFLFDAVTPGCDIIIGIMPPGKTEGTFTIYFKIPEEINKIPFLGLTHGDMTAQQKIDNTCYVTTNTPDLEFTFVADEPYEDESKKEKNIYFSLKRPEEFTCDYFTKEEELKKYMDDMGIDEPRIIHEGPRGEKTHGNHKWQQHQIMFQKEYVKRYIDTVSQVISDTDSDKAVWEGLYLLELKEHVKVIPRNTTKAYINNLI